MPETVSKLIAESRDTLILILLSATTLFAVGFLVLLSKVGRLNRLYSRLTRSTSGGSLEAILHEHMDAVNGVISSVESQDKRITKLEENQQHCLQKVGIVRFDAFEEVGGEQSFAVVMLDNERNGVSLSSVYSRSDVRVYAKAIKKGEAGHKLTEEEQKAMSLADGK
jgi:hypothetical protein